MSISSNNSRIAKNTVVLYLRMLFCMGLAFYTTRLVLKVLGVEDFGIVNVISSVAGMFVFITSTLSSACSRYFSYEIGLGERGRVQQIFSLMLFLYACAAVVLLVLFETVGLWYVGNKLVCAPDRLCAAKIFFQCIVAQTLIGWFAIPYNSLIVSHEDMSYFAVLAIVDSVMKLLSAIGIMLVKNIDHLVAYGICLVVASLIHTAMNVVFARSHYRECRLVWYFDRTAFVAMCAFNGWKMLGTFFWMIGNVLVNLLLNLFFGPVVNAAKGVSQQLMSAARALNENFLAATRPQIVKLWAAEAHQQFLLLLQRASKLSFFFVWLFAFPLYCEADYVLTLWLGMPPEYSAVFVRIIIVTALANSFVYPIAEAIQATGRISVSQTIEALSYGLVFPVAWVSLKFGNGPASVLWILFAFTLFNVAAQLVVASRVAGVPLGDFIIKVHLRIAILVVVSMFAVRIAESLSGDGLQRFLVVGNVSVAANCILFWYVCLTANERRSITRVIRERFQRWR